MIQYLKLNDDLLLRMYDELQDLIDDPISMDAFYLEMRLCNDPNIGKHAEDYNLMVSDMVKGSQQRTNLNMGAGITPSLENQF